MQFVTPLNGGNWTNGDPSTGTEPSIPGADFFEVVNTELTNLVSGSGQTPDPNDLTQVFKAVQNMVTAATPTLSNALIFTATTDWGTGIADGDMVYLDTNGTNLYEKAAHPTRPIGMANVTDGILYYSGKLPTNFLTGLTIGNYYLSDATAGAISTTAPGTDPIKVGYAVGTADFYLQINKEDTRATDALFKSGKIFDANVVTQDVVAWDWVAKVFVRAQYGIHKPVGIADEGNNRVYTFGNLPPDFMTGLTPGADYYLSDVNPGKMTVQETTDGAYKIGTAEDTNEFFVDIDPYDSKVNLIWDELFLGDRDKLTFDVNGSWTVPANTYMIRVTLIGAGAGGGGTDNSPAAAGGGGRGGYTSALIKVTPGDVFTWTIGQGGVGGPGNGNSAQDGADGGATIFQKGVDTLLSVEGGYGGKGGPDGGPAGQKGANGSSYRNDTLTHASGGISLSATNATNGTLSGSQGGYGGGFDGGGGIPTINAPSWTKAGNGTTPGSGGGGAGGNVNAGGDGANGQAIIEH